MSSLPGEVPGSERSLSAPLVLLAAMGACFIYLLARNAGLFLSVPDEWVYSRSARLVPLDSVGVPSYLYFLAFKATSSCGSGFLDCARMLNSLFLVGAIPFIYLLCRRVGSRPVAFFVALLAVLGPINTYTAYFMPESLYFLMFWVLAWCALRGAVARPIVYGMVLGTIIALMALVKAHAVFLMPALVAFVVVRYFLLRSAQPAQKALLAVLGFFAAAIVVRFGLGYLFAGSVGLSLFGEVYGSVAPATADPDRYSRLLSEALLSLKGHGMALAALFALPLAALFYFPARHTEHDGAVAASREIKLFTFLVLASLLAVTTLFSANASSSNELETVARLHMRYYSFVLPLLLIIIADHAGQPSSRQLQRAWPPAAVFGGLAILAITSLLPSYVPGIVDSPELRGLTINPTVFSAVAVLGLLALIAWLVDTRLGARLFLFGVFPLAVAISGWRANGELRQNLLPDSYAKAGIFARQYIDKTSEPIVVIGADHSSLYRTMFYLDNAKATRVVVPAGQPIAAADVPADAKWLLVVGDQALPKSARREAEFGGFVLSRVGDEEVKEIDFTLGSWPGLIAGTRGLANPEPWGTWSDGSEVLLEFSKPLPREFTLVLKGHTIGDTDNPSTIVVGAERREIRLPSPRELPLSFSTDGSVRSIRFEIPWAKSMKELGVSEDQRRLGIGFVSIRIIGKVPGDPAGRP